MTVENATPQPEAAPVDAETAAMSDVWDALQAEDGGSEPPAGGPARGPDGKFVAKDGEAPKTEAQGEAPQSLEGEKSEGAAAPGSTAASAVPSDLPAEVKAAWAKLGPDEIKALTAHKASVDRKFSELGRQIEQVKPVADKLSAALASVPELQGYTADKLAQGALELAVIQAKLERGDLNSKVQLVAQIAQTYGVLPQLQAALTGQQIPQEQADFAALQQEISDLKSQLVRAQQPPDIDAHVSQVIERRELEGRIKAFASDKPLYSVVEHLVPQFIAEAKAANPAISFEDALGYGYQKAIDSQPALKAMVEAQGANKATSTPADTARADAAKKAAAINVKPAINGKPRVMSEDEAMSAEWDRMMAAS